MQPNSDQSYGCPHAFVTSFSLYCGWLEIMSSTTATLTPKSSNHAVEKKLAGYHQKHWSCKFTVMQMPNTRSEVLSFVHKQFLYEWNTQHADHLIWIPPCMLLTNVWLVHSVVNLGHADPGANQASFIKQHFYSFPPQIVSHNHPRPIPMLWLTMCTAVRICALCSHPPQNCTLSDWIGG